MGGCFVTIVGDEKHGKPTSVGGVTKQGASIVNRKFWSVFNYPNYVHFLMDSQKGLAEILQAVEECKMKASLDSTSPYKLEDFQAMFAKQMSHTAHGKLVLQFKEYTTVHDANK